MAHSDQRVCARHTRRRVCGCAVYAPNGRPARQRHREKPSDSCGGRAGTVHRRPGSRPAGCADAGPRSKESVMRKGVQFMAHGFGCRRRAAAHTTTTRATRASGPGRERESRERGAAAGDGRAFWCWFRCTLPCSGRDRESLAPLNRYPRSAVGPPLAFLPWPCMPAPGCPHSRQSDRSPPQTPLTALHGPRASIFLPL